MQKKDRCLHFRVDEDTYALLMNAGQSSPHLAAREFLERGLRQLPTRPGPEWDLDEELAALELELTETLRRLTELRAAQATRPGPVLLGRSA